MLRLQVQQSFETFEVLELHEFGVYSKVIKGYELRIRYSIFLLFSFDFVIQLFLMFIKDKVKEV